MDFDAYEARIFVHYPESVGSQLYTSTVEFHFQFQFQFQFHTRSSYSFKPDPVTVSIPFHFRFSNGIQELEMLSRKTDGGG